MNKSVATYALLVAAACIILCSGGWVAQHKVFWSGDETISYLCATGNQENFNAVASETEQTVVKAAHWQQLLVVNEPYCFQKIATELSISDLHPPLYFWVLHLYLLLFGFSLQAGVFLNIVLHLVSLFVLFALGRKLSLTPVAAATICLLWAASPAALSVDFYARQYELLGLIHLLYALCFLWWMKQPSNINILALVGCTTLGFVTHYSFVYTAGGYFVYALIRQKQIGRNHIVALASSYVVSALLLSMLHPHFMHQFQLQQQRAQSFDALKLVARAGKTLLTFCNFLVPVLLLKQVLVNLSDKILIGLAGCVLTLVAAGGWMFRKKLRWGTGSLSAYAPQHMSFPTFVALWIGMVSVFPYLLFITPFHAMGAPYLVCSYPFMAILLYKWIGRSQVSVSFCILLMLVGSGLSLYVFAGKQHALAPLRNQITSTERILSNHSDRRNMGRIIPYLQSHQTIRIENPIKLTEDTARIMPVLLLKSAYDNPVSPLSQGEVYYNFEDWGGFIAQSVTPCTH